MKKTTITYICDICGKEFTYDPFNGHKEISNFQITFPVDNQYGMTNYCTKKVDEMCLACTETLVDAFVSIKKS
jgi:hypothetical protein